MRRYLKILLTFVVFLAVAACARKPPPPPPQLDRVPYKEKAIRVYLKSDLQLNLYEGSPHSLRVCFYQLRDPNSFNQHAQDQNGLRKLLEANRFDASVTNAIKKDVQPGRVNTFALDRAEGTKYVGVAAGYYLLDSLEMRNMVRLFQIPVIVKKKGIIRRKKTIRPGTLDISLYLGQDSIQEFERE